MREVGTPFQAWRPSLRRSGRTLVLLALVVVAALTMVLAGVAHARRAPAWWRVDAPTAAMAEQAESFEHAVLAQMTLVRATEESWSVALSEEDINAWLATRLKPWMENRGLADELPAGSVVRVRVEEGAVLVGMESRGEVVWARMNVEVEGP
ncbi:MAG TPA: hypothetical protein VK157_05880, partial [Phycisphaerales bacterium]|nr:hypothetical protein [Phycisphaerales bacterium]